MNLANGVNDGQFTGRLSPRALLRLWTVVDTCEIVQELNHSGLVLENKRVDHFHPWFSFVMGRNYFPNAFSGNEKVLCSEFHQIREVLETFCHKDETSSSQF
jgi:hypothetical protein